VPGRGELTRGFIKKKHEPQTTEIIKPMNHGPRKKKKKNSPAKFQKDTISPKNRQAVEGGEGKTVGKRVEKSIISQGGIVKTLRGTGGGNARERQTRA